MLKDKKLSIIIPVLNEEENIAILTQKINFYLKKIKYHTSKVKEFYFPKTILLFTKATTKEPI